MRVVVKIGSSSLVDSGGLLQEGVVAELARDIAHTRDGGVEVIVVSSGAIAAGTGVLNRSERPTSLPGLQATSAIGQGVLFREWSRCLAELGRVSAQVLLTMHDFAHRGSYLNARATIAQLGEWGVVPIINENDTTATDEITFGDNDMLAAQVAVSIGADVLILLTDIEGLFTAHPDTPGAKLIRDVTDHSLLGEIDTAVPGSHWGSGGMRSKVIAAEMASYGGAVTYITASSHQDVVSRIAAGEHLGTRVAADRRTGSSYKLWLRYAKPTTGAIIVDDGARSALVQRGASLLPVGVVGVEGDFTAGDAVTIVAFSGETFAKGIVEHSAADLRRMLDGRADLRGSGEAVHRDQLVVMGQ